MLFAPQFANVELHRNHNDPNYSDFQQINYTNAGRFVDFEVAQYNLKTEQLTLNSHTGYSRVIVKQEGNGHREVKFNTPLSHPNIYPDDISYDINPPSHIAYSSFKNWFDFQVSNGLFPNIWIDNDIFRGKKTDENIFYENNNLLKKVETVYDYKIFLHDYINF